MNTKTFPLEQILSVTTGRLLVKMDGIYEILNHITGDNLFTHVLPRANRFAVPLILTQHPSLVPAGEPQWLGRLDTLIGDAKSQKMPTDFACGIWVRWLKERGTLGLLDHYEVKSHEDQWLAMDPLEEPILQGKNVVAVKTD